MIPKTHEYSSSGSRVAIYARVATRQQTGRKHLSLDAQIDEMQKAALQKGWEVVGVFIDIGVSGRKGNSLQLDAALALADRDGFDILMVYELSRLSRSAHHILDILNAFKNLGTHIASLREPGFDINSISLP